MSMAMVDSGAVPGDVTPLGDLDGMPKETAKDKLNLIADAHCIKYYV